MTSDAIGTAVVPPPDDMVARSGGGQGAHPLLSRPGLALPLLLVAVALAAVLGVSANIWRLGTQAADGGIENLDWTFAQAQVAALRLEQAARDYAEDPFAAPEFARRRDLLADRLRQVDSGPARQLARGMGLDDDIAAARGQLLAHDPRVRVLGRQDLAELAARLALLEQGLALAGRRANGAYDDMKAGRVETARNTILLGASAVLAGLLGLALLGRRMLRVERRLLDGLRLQRDLQRQRDDASYMRNIAAVVAHQMRGPLAVIDGAAQRMLGHPDLAGQAEVGAAMLRIRRQVRRLLHFMDQAMLAGTVETRSPEIRAQAVPAGDLVALVLASDLFAEGRDGLVPPPAGAARRRVLCDRDLAFHALANLVENALKYSPDHSLVEVQVAQAGGMAVISVADRGRGIPAAEQEAIFQRFQRGSNAGDRPGTGIGLWLARRLAEVQGGTIRVSSDGRSGARFDLCLPAAGDPRGAGNAGAGFAPAPDRQAQPQGPRDRAGGHHGAS